VNKEGEIFNELTLAGDEVLEPY